MTGDLKFSVRIFFCKKELYRISASAFHKVYIIEKEQDFPAPFYNHLTSGKISFEIIERRARVYTEIAQVLNILLGIRIKSFIIACSVY